MPIDQDGRLVNDPSYIDQSCGAKNPDEKFLDPVHFDCRECRRRISMILLARVPERKPIRRQAQLAGSWMDRETKP